MEWVALSAGRCGSECVEYSLTNPFEKFERKRFLYYSKDLSIIAMNHALYSKMNKEDWDRVKSQMQEDLQHYYSNMGGVQKRFDYQQPNRFYLS